MALFHHRDQQQDFLIPAARVLQMLRQRAVEDVRGIALSRHLSGQFGELFGVRVREQTLALIAIHAIESLGGQLVQAFDDLLHRRGGSAR